MMRGAGRDAASGGGVRLLRGAREKPPIFMGGLWVFGGMIGGWSGGGGGEGFPGGGLFEAGHDVGVDEAGDAVFGFFDSGFHAFPIFDGGEGVEGCGDGGGEVDFFGSAFFDVLGVDGFGAAFVEDEHDVFVVVFALHEIDEGHEFFGVAFDLVELDRHLCLHPKENRKVVPFPIGLF